MRAPDHGVPTDDAPPVASEPAVEAPVDAPPVDAPPADAPPVEDEPLTPEQQAEADKAEFQPHGAPEGDYEFQMPDGVELDKSMLDAFAPVAKQLDLSAPGAQKLVEMYIEKVQPALAEAFVKGIEADVENQKAQFAADTKALIIEDAKAAKPEDRVFDGNNLDATMKTSARALDRFGTPELRKFLDESGLGNNPEVVKFTYKIGKLIGEDNDFIRGGQVTEPKTREQKYYGS